MEKLIKITKDNYPEMYNKELEKYLLISQDKSILGTAFIDTGAKTNKININILEEYRSNGYGNFMFEEILKEYKEAYDDKELRFEVNSQNKFNNILHKHGSINIANKNGTTIHVLPIKRG